MLGIVFGLVDNGVLLFCSLIGFRYFENKYGPIYGALIGNTISDCMAALLDPTLYMMALGITLGCTIPLLLFIVYNKYNN